MSTAMGKVGDGEIRSLSAFRPLTQSYTQDRRTGDGVAQVMPKRPRLDDELLGAASGSATLASSAAAGLRADGSSDAEVAVADTELHDTGTDVDDDVAGAAQQQTYEYDSTNDEPDTEEVHPAEGAARAYHVLSPEALEAHFNASTLPSFFTRHSGVVREALARDPEAPWVQILLPAQATPLEEFMRPLKVLEALLGEPPAPPMAVFLIRTQPLSTVLARCSGQDLANLAKLIDYLQLPHTLRLRVVQQCAAATQLGRSCAAHDTPLLEFLRMNGIMSEMLDTELSDIEAKLGAMVARTPAVGEQRTAFSEGLCGDPFLESTDDTTPAEKQLRAVWHTVGRIISRRPLVRGMSAEYKGDAFPSAVAAAFGYTDELLALLEDDWTVDDTIVHREAFKGNMPLLRAMCSSAGFRCDQPTLEAVAVAGARNGCVDTLKLAARQGMIPAQAWVAAARAGHLSTVQYLWEEANPGHRCELAHLGTAAAAGHLHILKYLVTLPNVELRGAKERILSEAQTRGNWHPLVVSWAEKMDCPLSTEAITPAAASLPAL
jgi:hypothetical protein